MTNLKNRSIAGGTKNAGGQAMTEYILIVSLVGIGCLMVTWSFGHQVAELLKRSTRALETGQVERGSAVHAEDNVGLAGADRFGRR